MKLYCLYDVVADRYTHFMLAENDGMYVREMIAHRVSFPLNFEDCVVKCIDENWKCPKGRSVSWTAWKQPESEAELLAPLGLSAEETRQIVERRIKEKVGA